MTSSVFEHIHLDLWSDNSFFFFWFSDWLSICHSVSQLSGLCDIADPDHSRIFSLPIFITSRCTSEGESLKRWQQFQKRHNNGKTLVEKLTQPLKNSCYKIRYNQVLKSRGLYCLTKASTFHSFIRKKIKLPSLKLIPLIKELVLYVF